ncbi:hypothetical protein BDR06DRAFT_948563 [Suillus hirtellus]|nr:hypothetical protein BDR06DRAFT_948563 [Suillus hirtellus]
MHPCPISFGFACTCHPRVILSSDPLIIPSPSRSGVSIENAPFPSRAITGVIIVLVTAAMDFTNMESITRVPTSKTPEQARPLVLSASRPRWWLVNFVISSVDGLTIGPSRQSLLERVSYLSRKG